MPLFAKCTDHELERIDALTTELMLPGGRVLAHQGRPAREMIFVVSGRVALVRDGRAVEILDRNAFIGAPELFTGAAHQASAVALTDVTIRAAGAREAQSLAHAVPSLGLLAHRGAVREDQMQEQPIIADGRQIGANR